MGGCDQPFILTDCSLEETANLLSPVVRKEQPEPLDVDMFGILTDDSPLRYIGFDQQGCHSSLVYQTPNGSRYWCPDVSSHFKPVVGKIYLTWDEVYKMYETYGEMSGFQIRVAGYKKWKGEITHRVLVCNKAGKPRGKMIDSVHPASMSGARSSCFKVTGCKALIRLGAIKGITNYVLYEFSENHNHELVSSENMDLTRKGKHLNFDDLHFVHAMSLNRVGATVAHRLQTSLKGGHHNMRGTRNSYKNISRDIRMFIGDRDVQLVLKKLEDRAKNLHNFSFEIHHFEGVLQAIFWADDVSKLSYQLFGDVIAFDATYSTNKLHKLVWNVYISTATFEEKWHNLMAEYALENHIWLNEMFSIRELWVPCYFRDIPMCCLMKTTSRCESSNSMFKVTSGSTNTLVQFLMCFDTAIDNQRYNQRVVDFKSRSTTCVFRTGLELEVHASKIYTQTIFKDVQKEIYKCMINCFITNVDVVDNFKVFTVSHMDNRSDFVNHFKVSVHMLEHSYECSCMGFTRVGYLCRHIFCVFRLHQIKNIPDRYISNRWRKGSLPSRVYSISQSLSVDNSEVSVLRNEVADYLNECVDHLAFNVDGLSSFNQKMKDLKRELDDNFSASSSSQKKQCVIEHLVGQHDEDTIDLLPPHGIRNKGCGTNRRLVGPGEKAIENSKKNPRMCRSCN
ncbi:hypothetical protein E3N88_34490 [Mikania micrantha]|uniref:SWIM-type domain-containing protein n=2 Tax=Mikania micrantha TaxID=192012 RepID=A0A5N6LY99_9ASTR|nr:hypothetical protein E3N88_34490 [Mikania micrantha]